MTKIFYGKHLKNKKMIHKKSITVAKNKDKFLSMLVKESNYGYLRIGQVMEELNLSKEEVMEMFFFFNNNWIKNSINKNNDYEFWVTMEFIPQINYFLEKGGFTLELEKTKYEYLNKKYSLYISILALIISIVSLFFTIK